MAIPSGSGTEVLKRTHIQTLTNSPQKLIDGSDANHIITILNIIFCEASNTDELLQMYIYPSANSNQETRLLRSQPIPAYGTFVWNEKIVLVGTDELLVETSTQANIDVTCNYILQDWS
tara:strand:- start:1027 stop:1383 length:357 start_codon:yes stop_codon:yes gene_type:complete